MIKVGDHLPNVTFTVMTSDGPKPKTTDEVFKGKKVVLFALPGAFTPTCDRNHLPSYRDNAAAIKAKGVDTIACLSVNDAFVMGAWSKASNAQDVIEFLADGSGIFTIGIGMALDLTERGMGIRSKRYSMLVEDGVVRSINLEENPGIAISGAENILTQL
ncbi:MAG: peroxiredoxin [Alphaproteobacteria bacterium]|nr:peroxiredoxin [Alphaproteobacteria bacterium]